MAERNAEGGGSFPLNLNTLLILLTLASSVWLVSQKLTSTRPAAPAGKLRDFPGEQRVESRLWEDPFKTPEQHSKGDDPTGTNLTTLLKQIKRRSFRAQIDMPVFLSLRTLHSSPQFQGLRAEKVKSPVQLLPVLLPGGAYSENQEDRIRSRFAIVSALSQSDYDPEDAEHIGSVTLSWPTPRGIDTLKQNSREWPLLDFVELWPLHREISLINETATSLDLRYEWYKLRPPHLLRGITDVSTVDSSKSNLRINPDLPPYVLVLWLNERYFEDELLLRLPLLLAPIMEAMPKYSDPRVTLIGPRRSSTLRDMLPDRKTNEVLLQIQHPGLWQKITKILQYIDVYSATARAMDAILVRARHDDHPRGDVGKALTEKIRFKSFQNFVATDDQLASEMLSELALRNIDFTKPDNHLVLLSEGDNFYAQVLSLTYATELAKRQNKKGSQNKKESQAEADFVQNYINRIGSKFNDREKPTNLHAFVYLRGLDGQTLVNDSESARDSRTEDSVRAGPASLEDLRKWSPDANKAEGSAQFDYLSRLGDRLADLEKDLSKQGEHIKAIGVVGTDVYDILLILQALRHQFPNALFFTMDLDARFWHPREESWSRNLLVTSGYGLRLGSKLQISAPPFRDSSQTAQFAAALTALGHPGLRKLTCVPPRRFEIGKRDVVDLSVLPSPNCMGVEGLHPQTPRTLASSKNSAPLSVLGICLLGFAAMLSLTCFCRPLRRLTWGAFRFQAEALSYREADVGGIEGSWMLVMCLRKWAQEQKDCFGQWLVDEFHKTKPDLAHWRPPTNDYAVLLDRIEEAKKVVGKAKEDKAKEEATQEIERCKDALFRKLIDFLNRLLHQQACYPGDAVKQTRLLGEKLQNAFQCWWPAQQGRDPNLPKSPQSPQQLCQGRIILDTLLQTLVKQHSKLDTSVERDTLQDILHKAKAARDASLKLYVLRCRWVRQFWILAVLMIALAIALGFFIWWDTSHHDFGEPFSLSTGTSAWPAEILRFAALALAVSFCVQAYQSLQNMRLQLTQRFRLSLLSGSQPARRVRPWQRFKDQAARMRGICRQPVLRAPGVTVSPEPVAQTLGSQPARRIRPWQRFKDQAVRMWRWLCVKCGQPPPLEPGATVSASKLWEVYQQYGSIGRRLCRLLCLFMLYIMTLLGISFVWGSQAYMVPPLRGDVVWWWDSGLLLLAVLSFLFLTFMTIDAARLCQWFIQCLSEAPTEYTPATTDHFSRLRGDVDRRYLDEWIDLQLIADLTERVGRLVYYPSIVFFLLLLARNEWWDHWPWPWVLITIFACNFPLAAISVVILQNAARKAKRTAEATLEAKVKRLQAATAESQLKNNANQAEKLLEEIRSLRRGAFVPFWENPVLGAILLPSGGTAVLQMLVLVMGR